MQEPEAKTKPAENDFEEDEEFAKSLGRNRKASDSALRTKVRSSEPYDIAVESVEVIM